MAGDVCESEQGGPMRGAVAVQHLGTDGQVGVTAAGATWLTVTCDAGCVSGLSSTGEDRRPLGQERLGGLAVVFGSPGQGL